MSTVIAALAGGFFVLLNSHGKPHVVYECIFLCPQACTRQGACRHSGKKFLLGKAIKPRLYAFDGSHTTRGGSYTDLSPPKQKETNSTKKLWTYHLKAAFFLLTPILSIFFGVKKGEASTKKLPLLLEFWSGKRVSNSRPQPWQGCALPTELFPH